MQEGETIEAQRTVRVRVTVEPYAEGGFGVRSPDFPELITEGDTFEEAVRNADDAVRAVLELYEDLGKPLPAAARIEDPEHHRIAFDVLASPA